VVGLAAFQQRHADALGHPAERLAVRQWRVDDPPGVVDRVEPPDPDGAEQFVDGDLGEVLALHPRGLAVGDVGWGLGILRGEGGGGPACE
jgi:hypothetical protein